MSGQWEVVKSGRNKHNNNKNAITKTTKNKNALSAANNPTGVAIQESKTLFNLLQEQDEDQPIANGKAAPKTKTKASKKADKKAAAKKPTCIEDALSELPCAELEKELAENKARFPVDPVIWIKELCRHLNQLLNFPTPDPVFTDKPSDYPLSAVPTEVYGLLWQTVQALEPSQQAPLLEYLLTTTNSDMNKDLQTYGYRLVIQCLLKMNPSLILQVIPKCRDLKNSCQNRHPNCLSLLWAAGQAGFHDLNTGIKVWLELMMSLAGVKAYNKYVVSYLDALLRYHHHATSCPALGVKELISLLDFMHPASSTSTSSQQLILKGLQDLYPKLKRLSYGPNPEAVLHSYFPSYLVRLKPGTPSALRAELSASLVDCLVQDPVRCFSAWRQLYTRHLPQSGLLLQAVVKRLDSLPRNFPRKHLLETVRTFQVTNEDLASSRKQPDGLAKCTSHCQELLGEMANSWKLPWRRLLRLVVVGLLVALALDLYRHGGFHQSKTGKYLTETGAVSAGQQAWTRVHVYYSLASKWGGEKLEQARPHLHWGWDQLSGVRAAAWTHSEPLRVYLAPHLSKAGEWGQEAGVAGKRVWVVVQGNLAWAQRYAAMRMDQLLTGELAPERLHHHATEALSSLHHLVLQGYQWLLTPSQ